MNLRTTKKTVTFVNPFRLESFNESLPPGDYEVETDEELIDGLSFQAYRRTLTLMRLPTNSGHSEFARTLTIDPIELDAALKRDAELGPGSSKLAPLQETFNCAPKQRQTDTDRRAVERAEDEGMILHSH